MWKGYRGRCLTSNQTLESEASSSLISESPLLLLLATNSSEHPPPVTLCPSPALPTLTDALVHVGVAGIEVSRRAGRQADAHLADVVPLQQDEQLGGALEAAVDLRAELAAFGAGLAPLGTDCKGGTRVRRWL